MKFKYTKPGNIIRTKTKKEDNAGFQDFHDERWKVVEVYSHVVLARSVKCPAIRRCFSYGDLVVLGIE